MGVGARPPRRYSRVVSLDPLVRNRSLFAARCLSLEDHRGREVATVIAKLSLYVSPSGVVARSLAPEVRLFDEPRAKDRPSSLRAPNDAVPEKPGTDVLILATARPPAGAARQMDVTVEAGHLRKVVRVFGPRVWTRGAAGRVVPGPPAALSDTPLEYERAYGGIDTTDPDRPLVESHNPVGTGVARDPQTLLDTEAPSLEDPSAPLDGRHPAPVGVAPIASSWSPRAEWAGTFDETWRRTRAPVPPADFDPRHYSSASPGLFSEAPFRGGEWVSLSGITAAPLWRFQLPRFAPRFSASVRGNRADLPTHLDTVLIDADHKHVELSWRASIPLPRRLSHLESIEITSEGLLPPGALQPNIVEIREALGMVSPHG